jgi:hypothetical protein
MDTKPLVTEVIADSDFFIANSVLQLLFQGAGLPPVIASVGSVVVAAVPSQLLKLGTLQKERKVQEEEIMQQLLLEQQTQQKKHRFSFNELISVGSSKRKVAKRVDPKELTPIVETQTDLVAVFSDVARWLSYGALKTDFGDSLFLWNGQLLDPSLSGAALGFIAASSSQLYADVLYGLFRYGPKSKQEEVLSRKSVDWGAVYASRALSAAALFGVYEFSQRPISRWIQGILAGGFDGCVGSQSFDACMQTYIDVNAPGPSPTAQFRALTTNLIMVGERLRDVAGDTSPDELKSLVGAWGVAGFSYFQSLSPIPLLL